jgi:hypothetical protein
MRNQILSTSVWWYWSSGAIEWLNLVDACIQDASFHPLLFCLVSWTDTTSSLLDEENYRLRFFKWIFNWKLCLLIIKITILQSFRHCPSKANEVAHELARNNCWQLIKSHSRVLLFPLTKKNKITILQNITVGHWLSPMIRHDN